MYRADSDIVCPVTLSVPATHAIIKSPNLYRDGSRKGSVVCGLTLCSIVAALQIPKEKWQSHN